MKRRVVAVVFLIVSLPSVALAGHTAGGTFCSPVDNVTCFDDVGGGGGRSTAAPKPDADLTFIAFLAAILIAYRLSTRS
jgi:hypothetical protein